MVLYININKIEINTVSGGRPSQIDLAGRHSPHCNCTSLCLAFPTILGGWQGPGGTLNVRTGTLTVHCRNSDRHRKDTIMRNVEFKNFIAKLILGFFFCLLTKFKS